MTDPSIAPSALTEWWLKNADTVQSAVRSMLDDPLTRLFTITFTTNDGPIGIAGELVVERHDAYVYEEHRLIEPMREFVLDVELPAAVERWDPKAIDQQIRELLGPSVGLLRDRVRRYLLSRLRPQNEILRGRTVPNAVAELVGSTPGRTYRFASPSEEVLAEITKRSSTAAVEVVLVHDLTETQRCQGLLVDGTQQRPEATFVSRPPLRLAIGSALRGSLRSRLVAAAGGSTTYRLV